MDDQTRMAVYRAIYSKPTLQRYQLGAVPPIHIIVKNGDVTLEGVVANEMDKDVAGIAANGVGSVHKVINNLRTDSGSSRADFGALLRKRRVQHRDHRRGGAEALHQFREQPRGGGELRVQLDPVQPLLHPDQDPRRDGRRRTPWASA